MFQQKIMEKNTKIKKLKEKWKVKNDRNNETIMIRTKKIKLKLLHFDNYA